CRFALGAALVHEGVNFTNVRAFLQIRTRILMACGLHAAARKARKHLASFVGPKKSRAFLRLFPCALSNSSAAAGAPPVSRQPAPWRSPRRLPSHSPKRRAM